MKLFGRFLMAALSTISYLGCGPARSVRSPRSVEAKPAHDAVLCRKIGPHAAPLVVDMSDAERAALENAMQRGVAVVAYGCDGIRLLRECTLPGGYAFLATSRKTESVQLVDRDEARANLPTTASQLEKLSIGWGFVVDVATVTVGKRTTTVSRVDLGDLDGKCEGATHFVRSAAVGAFAMRTGKLGAVRPAAKVFESQSDATVVGAAQISRAGGVLASCEKVALDADTPPSECATFLKLDLVAFGAPVPAIAQPPDLEPNCPSGMVRAEGKCVAAPSVLPHQCGVGDLADCDRECARGHAGSCVELGLSRLRRDPSDSGVLALFQKACDSGEPIGCTSLGIAYEEGCRDTANAVTSFQKACDGGEPSSCSHLGWMFEKPAGVAQDRARAAGLFQRACAGGDMWACEYLGYLHARGDGLKLDHARAAALVQRSCDGGRASACSVRGAMLEQGVGGAVDCDKAAHSYEKACKLGETDTCNKNRSKLCAKMGLAFEPKDGVFKTAKVDGASAGFGVTSLVALSFTAASSGFAWVSATGKCRAVEPLPASVVLRAQIQPAARDSARHTGDASFEIGGSSGAPPERSFEVMRVLPAAKGANTVYLNVDNATRLGRVQCSATVIALFGGKRAP